MRKILICLEDYNELLYLETFLKRLGFDVEAIRNEVSITERMMSFAPDLVIATGEGAKINGGRVSKKVKRKGMRSNLLLVFPRQRLAKEPRILDSFAADGAIETPVQPRDVIHSVARLTGVDEAVILAKFEKMPMAQDFSNHDEMQIISGKKQEKTESQRIKGYEKFLKDVPDTKQNGLPRQAVDEQVKETREYYKTHKEEVDAIDKLRQEFVKALYKRS